MIICHFQPDHLNLPFVEMKHSALVEALMKEKYVLGYINFQEHFRISRSIEREFFLLEVNNGETIAAIESNNDTYCLQKRIEKFPLMELISKSNLVYDVSIFCM